MRVAISTMVFNEVVNLPVWLRHYRLQCPDARLVVLDHGSNDGSTSDLADADVISLARTAFDEVERSGVVADLRRSLLRDHEVVIFTDCDEILVADPAKYSSLAAFLEAVPDDVIAPAGLHVLHDFETEPALDPARPILAQRRFVEFGSGMCKPMISRVPLTCDVGFHGADRRPTYRSDLIHFHLGYVDRDIALERLALTRTMAWSEATLTAGHGFHQRMSDDDYLHRCLTRPVRLLRQGAVQPFDFTPELGRLERSLERSNGFWHPVPHFRGRIAQIPEDFRQVF